ncbi:MAG TPA: tetratricopeptide repeat protein [Aggregatilinea sp.]|jgi:LuxR family maltose regulon positive regulatory protein|uniref:tetratricopeptide repeat protein n=1 Tax=Aggregatilinea sp. TaxID=2806333 RepID=UPI002BFD337F|nr:tetratricopeptide repeat protein [Aggregatilinea sp.]HML20738.1 tetratricopeptide repeat protein [Aggregatilinea sp.]
MASTILQRAAHIPHFSGVIQRPVLLERLQAVGDHKLTLVCAPPGYGKSTIVAQFAYQSSYVAAWQTIEERDRDVPNLYRQSLAALETVAAGIQDLPADPVGYTPGELSGLIADYVRNAVTDDFVYVLDDIQYLAGAPGAETWLRAMVSMMPANCHMVLIGRILPDLPLTEMIARREVLALGQEQLKFTPTEIDSLAREVLGLSPSPAEVYDLASRLEGWPAGVFLALRPLPADLEHAMLNGGEGPEGLFDALASLMLRAQPPALRDFLLASSTLERLTPDLCTAALGLRDSTHWISEVQSRNLFISRVANGLTYHRLFRTLLQRQLKETNPNLYYDLHARAARWFEDNNRIDEAFEHYLNAGLYKRAVMIAEQVSRSYFTQGKVETLLTWQNAIAKTGVVTPRLAYACALIHTDRYAYQLAEAELDQAETGFTTTENEVGIAEVQLQRAMINLQRGQYELAISQAMPFRDAPRGPSNLRGRALRVIGFASVRLGRVEEAVRSLEEALPLFKAYADAYALTNLLQDLEMGYTRLGRSEEANACLQEVVALRRSLGSAGALALALNNLGYHYHQLGDYQQAYVTFQEGLRIVTHVPDKRAESYLRWSLGDLQRDQGNFEDAIRLYNKSLELIGGGEPHLRASVLASASNLQRWRGKYYEALLLADEANALAETHNVALERALAQAAFWAARAQSGQLEDALKNLHAVVNDLKRQGIKIELVQVLGQAAHVALLAEDMKAAQDYLRTALTTARDGGSLQPLIAEVVHVPVLHQYVLGQFERDTDLLRRIDLLRDAQLKTRQDSTAVAPAAVRPETYSLRVLTLGQESVERDGRTISPSEWRAASAKELFFYLLFEGVKTREQISLIFWPDSPTKRVRSNFHTTLYRARQAVGENTLLFENDRYFINPELDVLCDANEMEGLARQARLLSPHDARTEDLWRRAVTLYRGEFLTALDADWAYTRRETYHELYLEALIGLGMCARARGDLREALATFKQALEVDPFREDIHRAIMLCYAESGEKNKVHVQFQELKTLLQEELAVEPTAETLKLVQSLLG